MEGDKKQPSEEGSHAEQLHRAEQAAAAARGRIEELQDSHRVGADMDELEDAVQAAWMTQQAAEAEIRRLTGSQSKAHKMASWVWRHLTRKTHR